MRAARRDRTFGLLLASALAVGCGKGEDKPAAGVPPAIAPAVAPTAPPTVAPPPTVLPPLATALAPPPAGGVPIAKPTTMARLSISNAVPRSAAVVPSA